MSNPEQTQLAAKKNRDFFADNDHYKDIQSELEHYKFIALSARNGIAGAGNLLDIGNGGVFIYKIDDVPSVTAIDIFVEESFSKRYPSVKWMEMSALKMPFVGEFDTAIEINTLHHIIGRTVRQNYDNLSQFFREVHRALKPNGRLVLLESTVSKWFLCIYNLIFPLFSRFWPFKHPPTYQFHYRDLLKAATASGFELCEFCWVPKTSDVLAFGIRLRPWMVPAKTAKMIFIKK